jgi:hypothetical protein
MGVYKRGGVYWFKFRFEGQVIRESAKTASKTVAKEAEKARRRQLEMSINGIIKRERLPLFSVAAKEWFESKIALTSLGRAYYRQYLIKLNRELGGRLVSDITADDIAALQTQTPGRKDYRVGRLTAKSLRCVQS